MNYYYVHHDDDDDDDDDDVYEIKYYHWMELM